MDIITIANSKGGCCKSTTASALTSGLRLRGAKTLAIDLDPQCNLSNYSGADLTGLSITDCFENKADVSQVIQKETNLGDFIASSSKINLVAQTMNAVDQILKLKTVLAKIKDYYDYIVIDTPPALSPVTVNALATSTKVVVPVQSESFSLQGVESLSETLEGVKTLNPDLKIDGILLCRLKKSNFQNYMHDTFETYAEKLHTKVYKSTVRDCIALQESVYAQKNIFEYDPKSNGAVDYDNFINEFLGR